MVSKDFSSFESSVWSSAGGTWKKLYGSIRTLGLSIEYHDFHSDHTLEWGKSFHPDSVEICLNLQGTAEIEAHGTTTRLKPATCAYYARTQAPLRASRPAGQHHRFITVEFSHAWLARILSQHRNGLGTVMRNAVFGEPSLPGVSSPREMTPEVQTLAHTLLEPTVPVTARALWFEAKAMELLADFSFSPDQEMFCDRQKRVEKERIQRLREIIAEHITEPPTLDEMARLVGVSPFYLSRTFSAATGRTIPQYLRTLRMEKAADLLRAGSHNVTEAAFAVGYSSLGHFSKAFTEEIGTPPAAYARAVQSTDKR